MSTMSFQILPNMLHVFILLFFDFVLYFTSAPWWRGQTAPVLSANANDMVMFSGLLFAVEFILCSSALWFGSRVTRSISGPSVAQFCPASSLRLAGCETNLRICQRSNTDPASQCARGAARCSNE